MAGGDALPRKKVIVDVSFPASFFLCVLFAFVSHSQVTPVKDGKGWEGFQDRGGLFLCSLERVEEEELQAELIAWPEDKSPKS